MASPQQGRSGPQGSGPGSMSQETHFGRAFSPRIPVHPYVLAEDSPYNNTTVNITTTTESSQAIADSPNGLVGSIAVNNMGHVNALNDLNAQNVQGVPESAVSTVTVT